VQKEPMLRATYVRLSEELERLKSVERNAIAAVIDEAREQGDLKENAEYHAAKDEQGLMEARIAELTDIVGRAQVIEPERLAHQRISFGSTVLLVDQESYEEVSYTIVGGQESNPSRGLISISSPLAKAILGKEEGDEVSVKLPSGSKKYDIEEVSFVEIVLDK
jgi:transcription elongation factor GreA